MEDGANSRRKLGRRIMWGVIAGVVVYGALAAFMDLEALIAHLGEFPWSIFGAALALSVVNYSIRWGKWHYYLALLDIEVGRRDSIIVFIAGLTMSITPGKVGEVLKSVLLRQSHGVSVARSAPIVVAERLTDLFGLFVIAGFGIAVFDYGRIAFVVVLATLVVGILLLQSLTAANAILNIVERLPIVGSLRPRLEEAYESTRGLIGWRALVIATLLSAVSWSMEAVAFYWILGGLGAADVAFNLAAFIFAMTTIIGAVSFLPGGLGVTEGSMIGALLLFGIFADEAAATAATYLIRLATLWFAVGLGVIGIVLFERLVARVGDDEPHSA